MPWIYGVIGSTVFDRSDRAPPKVWTVVCRFSEAEAHEIVETCETQQALFLEELKPIWAEIRASVALDTSYGRQRARNRQRNYEAISKQETKYRRVLAKLRERELAVNQKFAPEMLDPLFPTATNGQRDFKIKYSIMAFPEDPKNERAPRDLMIHRAQLWGGDDAQDDELEESED